MTHGQSHATHVDLGDPQLNERIGAGMEAVEDKLRSEPRRGNIAAVAVQFQAAIAVGGVDHNAELSKLVPVSYTHLTLPTILRV